MFLMCFIFDDILKKALLSNFVSRHEHIIMFKVSPKVAVIVDTSGCII